MIRGRSKERLLLAKNYYNLSKKISKAGVTHVAHIISGWGPGENIKLLDFKDLQKKYKDNTPFSRKQYNELIQHIPIKWKETLDNANKTKQNFPNCSLRAFLKKEVPKVGTWIQNTQGKIGLVETSKPCILHLFSGCADRPDGFAAYLKKNNFNCMEIDTKNNKNTQDLLNDNTYNKLIQLANEGYFVGALIGIPCGTFSVARIGAPENQPQQLRGRKLEEREGKPDNTRNQKREVLIANELIKRALTIAEIILNQKGNIIIENPIDRGDKNSSEKKIRDVYTDEYKDHCPLWLLPNMLTFKNKHNLRDVSLPQCAFKGDFQKWTTLWYSQSLENVMHELQITDCKCASHKEVARGKISSSDDWKSAEAAAYPEKMNIFLARAFCTTFHRLRPEIDINLPTIKNWYHTNVLGTLEGTSDQPTTITNYDNYNQIHVWHQQNIPRMGCPGMVFLLLNPDPAPARTGVLFVCAGPYRSRRLPR